jgi:hypothetical protein
LAEKLEVSYDHMVSLKLDNNLVLLRNLKVWNTKRNSARYFGIQENDLIDIIANAPAKSMLY